MKAAFTTWNDRISPVFDVAGQILLVESDSKGAVHKENLALPVGCVMDKLTFLDNQKVELLVCGAISHSLQCAVEARGIKVYPFCAGETSKLIDAWMNGGLDKASFSMPGCCKRRRRMGAGNSCKRNDLPRGRFNQRNRRQ